MPQGHRFSIKVLTATGNPSPFPACDNIIGAIAITSSPFALHYMHYRHSTVLALESDVAESAHMQVRLSLIKSSNLAIDVINL